MLFVGILWRRLGIRHSVATLVSSKRGPSVGAGAQDGGCGGRWASECKSAGRARLRALFAHGDVGMDYVSNVFAAPNSDGCERCS